MNKTNELIKTVQIKNKNGTFDVQVKDIENTVQAYQEFVEGLYWFSSISPFAEHRITIGYNDNSKALGLPITAVITNDNNQICDTLDGNIIFARLDDNYKNASLTDEQIEFILSYLENNLYNVNSPNGPLIAYKF